MNEEIDDLVQRMSLACARGALKKTASGKLYVDEVEYGRLMRVAKSKVMDKADELYASASMIVVQAAKLKEEEASQ